MKISVGIIERLDPFLSNDAFDGRAALSQSVHSR
jgi:hypothetical protein